MLSNCCVSDSKATINHEVVKNEPNPVDPNDTSKTLLDSVTLISTSHLLINEKDHKLAETK